MRKSIASRVGALSLGVLLCTAPLYAQDAKPETTERSSTKKVIRIVDNGKEQTLEITEKDGKTFLNGKPLEEASPEDKAMYDQFKVDEVQLGNGRVQLRVQSREGRPKLREEHRNIIIEEPKQGEGRPKVWEERSQNTAHDIIIERELEGRPKGRVFLREQRGDGPQVFRWEAEEDGRSNEGKPREERFDVELKEGFPLEGLHNMRIELPKRFRFYRDGMMEDFEELRSDLADLRGEMSEEIQELEADARELARKIEKAKSNEKAALEAKLDEKLNQIFDKKLEARRKAVEKMEERVAREKETLRTREKQRRAVIDRRKQQLLEKGDPLAW